MRPQRGRPPADWELPASRRARVAVAVTGLTLRPLVSLIPATPAGAAQHVARVVVGQVAPTATEVGG